MSAFIAIAVLAVIAQGVLDYVYIREQKAELYRKFNKQ